MRPRTPRNFQLGCVPSPLIGPQMPKPSVALWRPKPMMSVTARLISLAAAAERGEPGEAAPVTRAQSGVDRVDSAGQHVPEQEDEDPGGERGEARAVGRADAHPPDREAEEDGGPGDGAEEEDVSGAHGVRVALQRRYGQYSQMPQGHSIDEYLETIYFLAFP